MKYCSSCGNQIDENVGFCPHCGNRQSVAPVSRTASTAGKRLHCPRCKDIRISPIVETNVHSNVAHYQHSIRVNTNSTHREYWMCQSCGHKFRNLENLEEELVGKIRIIKPIIISIILFGFLMLLAMLTDWWLWGIILIVPVEILFVVILLTEKREIKKMTAQKKYLSVRCFD